MSHNQQSQTSGDPLGPESPSFAQLTASCAALRLSVARLYRRPEIGVGGRGPI
jgi:hypothetical protein